MSFTGRIAGGVLCALVAAFAVASCGSHSAATGFCATVQTGHASLDSIDAAHHQAALAEFDRVAATAPAAIANDFKAVSAFLHTLYDHPSQLAKDPTILTRYGAARKHIDSYLHRTCGLKIPPLGKLL